MSKLSHPDFLGHHIVYNEKYNFGRVEPYPTEEYLAKFYRKEYRNTKSEVADKAYLISKRNRSAVQSDLIKSLIDLNQIEKVMEIGCGAGLLLESLACENISLIGYEGDIAMSQVATRLNPNAIIINENFTLNKQNRCKNDLIMMSHVFEHIPNPKEFLIGLNEWLSERGYLFIEVPNDPYEVVRLQVEHGVKGLAHVNFFTLESLTDVLTDAGFKIIDIDTWGDDINQYWENRLNRTKVKFRLGDFIKFDRNKSKFSDCPSIRNKKRGKGMHIRAMAANF